MSTFKVILTGATGFVGEGVLLACLDDPAVERVLAVGRKPAGVAHPKLGELIVPDFMALDGVSDRLAGYDACFYCAGISSAGMSEADYRHITYGLTLHFANTLVKLNPGMVFSHVSGGHTDSSEQGKVMWARVKGQAENALLRLPFKAVYNLRPGFMKPTPGQKNAGVAFRIMGSMYSPLKALFPKNVLTLREVGLAMIHSVTRGYSKGVLEVPDIEQLARE